MKSDAQDGILLEMIPIDLTGCGLDTLRIKFSLRMKIFKIFEGNFVIKALQALML